MSESHAAPSASPGDNSRALTTSTVETALATFVQPQGAAPVSEGAINLREYWLVLVKRKWTVIGLLCVAVALALVITVLTTPLYRAMTVIQIEREPVKVVDFKDVTPNDTAGPDYYQTQYELLKSRSLAERVVDQLGLARKEASAPARGKSLTDWIAESVDGRNVGNPATQKPAAVAREEEARAAQAQMLLSSLTVEPVRNSRLVRLSFDSADPATAATVINAFAQNYVNLNLERRYEATAYAKTFLEERLAQVKLRLEEAERKMLEYARDYDIVALGGEKGGTTASRNLEDFNAALAEAQQARIKAEALFNQLQAATGGNLPQVLESRIIATLRDARVRLESEYQDKSNTYLSEHPTMVDLQGRIKEIEKQIAKEKKVIADSIRADYDAAVARERLIRQKFQDSKKEVNTLQTASIQYNILKREADTNRTLYEGLLQRYREVGVDAGVGSNNIFVVDKAEVPKGYFKPDYRKNLLIGLLVGLIAGIGVAFLFEHLDDTFKRPGDVEERLGLSVVGLIPESEEIMKGTSLIRLSVEQPRSGIVEAYRSVRTALQFAGEHGAPKVLALTSSQKGEGKTTSSVGIGIQFAQFGSKVLIIDADMRNPSLHKALSGANEVGLTNVLAGGKQPAEVTQSTPIANLYFMPTGPLPPNPAELLASNKMKELLDLAREKFDYVIIDSPPILGLADVLVIGNLADSMLLEIHAGTTPRSTVQAAVKRLANVRIRPLGCIMTRMRGGAHGYGYHYDYYYAYGKHDGDSDKRLAA